MPNYKNNVIFIITIREIQRFMPSNTTKEFIENTQSVHSRALDASMGMFFNKLLSHFLKGKTKDHYKTCIQRLYTHSSFGSLEKEDQGKIKKYVDDLCTQAQDGFDKITFFESGKDHQITAHLRDVLAIVYEAIYNTPEILSDGSISAVSSKELHVRLQILCRTLLDLANNSLCHTGVRNALLSILTFHHDYKFIGPIKDYIQTLATDEIIQNLKTQSPAFQWNIIRSWIRHDLDNTQESSIEVSKFIAGISQQTSLKINNFLQTYGVNPDWEEVIKMKAAVMTELQSLPAPCSIEFHENLPIIRKILTMEILQDAENSGETLKNAITVAREQIFAINNLDELPNTVRQLAEVGDNWNIAIKERTYFGGDTEITVFNKLLLICQKIANNTGAIDVKLTKEMQSVREQLSPLLADLTLDIHMMNNFFAIFDSATPEKKARLFVQMSKATKKFKAYISDRDINSLPVQAGEVIITPEFLTKMLLQALFVSPQYWTEPYANMLKKLVIPFLRGNLGFQLNQVKANGFKYYTKYVHELEWLVGLYERNLQINNDSTVILPNFAISAFDPNVLFPMLPNLEGFQGAVCGEFSQHIRVLEIARTMEGTIFVNIMQNQNFLGNISEVFLCLAKTQNLKRQLNLFTKEFFVNIIKNTNVLRNVVTSIPSNLKTALFSDKVFITSLIKTPDDWVYFYSHTSGDARTACLPKFLTRFIQNPVKWNEFLRTIPDIKVRSEVEAVCLSDKDFVAGICKHIYDWEHFFVVKQSGSIPSGVRDALLNDVEFLTTLLSKCVFRTYCRFVRDTYTQYAKAQQIDFARRLTSDLIYLYSQRYKDKQPAAFSRHQKHQKSTLDFLQFFLEKKEVEIVKKIVSESTYSYVWFAIWACEFAFEDIAIFCIDVAINKQAVSGKEVLSLLRYALKYSCKQVVAKLVEYMGEPALSSAFMKMICEPDVNKELAQNIVVHSKFNIDSALKIQNISVEVLAIIANKYATNEQVLAAIIAHPKVTVAILHDIANIRDISISNLITIANKFYVASTPPAFNLSVLSVLKVIIAHDDVTVEVLDFIANMPIASDEVLEAIIVHPKVTREILNVIADLPNVSTEVLAAIANKHIANDSVLEAVIAHPKVTQEILDVIVNRFDVSTKILAAIAHNYRHTGLDVLNRIGDLLQKRKQYSFDYDNYVNVIAAIVANPAADYCLKSKMESYKKALVPQCISVQFNKRDDYHSSRPFFQVSDSGSEQQQLMQPPAKKKCN